LVPTPAIKNLIREDKIHQIYGSMQAGQGKHGMQTLNQSLSDLVLRGEITQDTAFSYSGNQDELMELINRGVGTLRPGRPVSPLMGGRNPNIRYS
jgi:twitching motility protein PilT